MSSPLLALIDSGEDADRPCIVTADTALTRAEVWSAAAALAGAMTSEVAPGRRIGLVDTQDQWSIIGVLASWMAGRSVVLLPSDAASAGDGHPLAAMAHCGALLHGGRLDLRSTSPEGVGAPVESRPDAAVLVTSGTTRLPRGVRLSMAGIASNLTAMLRITKPWEPTDVLGLVLPVTHSFGLSMVLLALARRAPIVMLGDGPPSRRLASTLDDHHVTQFACVPYYLRLMTRRGITLGGDYGRELRTLYLAGGGIPDADLDVVLPGFTGEIYLMYGCTEATARVAVRRVGDGAAPDSVGLPLPGTHVDVVAPEGTVQPPGREGRIRIASPSLMVGYLGEPDREPGSPFLTSDYGVLNDNGDLTITGRDEEMHNFRGNRVSLPAVEARVATFPDVLEARLSPLSRDEDAQCVLQVVAAPGAEHEVIRREVTRQLSPRGLVREILFVDAVERTRSGKPLRRA